MRSQAMTMVFLAAMSIGAYANSDKFKLDSDSPTSSSTTEQQPTLGSTNEYDDVIETPIVFNVGVTQMGVSAKTFDFFFIDDSPAPDSVEVLNQDFGAGGLSYIIGVGLETPIHKPVHFGFHLEYQTGAIQYFKAGIQGGYNVRIGKKFAITPHLNLSYGRSDFEIGTIENTTGYIEIGDSEFRGDELEVSVKSHSVVAIPELALTIRPASKYQISLAAGYQFAFDIGEPFVSFYSPDGDNGEPFLEDREINPNNTYFRIDGKPVKKLPFDKHGLRFEARFGWFISKGSSK